MTFDEQRSKYLSLHTIVEAGIYPLTTYRDLTGWNADYRCESQWTADNAGSGFNRVACNVKDVTVWGSQEQIGAP